MRRVLASLLALLVLLGLSLGLWQAWVRRALWLPLQWDPTAPLDVAAPLTPVTRLKLARLRLDPAACRAALATAPLRWAPIGDMKGPDGCGWTGAVRVEGGPVAFAPAGFVASCPLAVDWAMFARHVLQPAAEEAFGQPVVQVAQLGSYACRDVRGGDRPSAHATADALDVAGFLLRGGRRITLADWGAAGPEGAFLRRLRAGACTIFGTVLSPEFDRAHATHFHLQATGGGFCR